LRPPLATERLLSGPDGLVRIALEKPFSDSDGTVAVASSLLSLQRTSTRYATRAFLAAASK
jgi:hypothetical protein